MNAESVLRRMCARLGLPPHYGARLLPLVERAMRSPDEVRERLLSLVEANLAHCARTRKDEQGTQVELDQEVLVAVARVLHGWSPSRLMLDIGDGRSSEPEAD